MTNRIIDISENNTISNFDLLVKSDLKGVIMKATEGTTFKDSIVDINYEALTGRIPIGFYHFLSATSEPKTQALNFWNTLKDKEFQIIPVLDVEENERAPLKHLSEPYAREFIQSFREISGQDIIIYSNRCYIEEYFSLEFRQANSWWIADYSANYTPVVLGCDVVAWQFTENYRNYPFIIGEVDCNNLVNSEKFFIENNLPYVEPTPEQNYNSIIELQKELNFQCYQDYNWNELEEDGIGGELTLSACPTLQVGAVGKITKWVQSKLHDILNCDLASDGIFGEQTRQAVIEFQSSLCLKGDGIVGKKTWKKLLGI